MTATTRTFVPNSKPVQLQSNLKTATDMAAKITQKYDSTYMDYARLVDGAGPRGPTGMPGFDTVQQVLEYVQRVEKDIRDLENKIKDINENETPQLEEIKEIAAKLGITDVLNRGGAGGDGY